MSLCRNRPEGFGPRSNISSHLPTACFTSIIVVPLATWIYLALLICVIPIVLVVSKSPSIATEKLGNTVNRRRNVVNIILKIIYYFLIVALIALYSLEIARLSVADLGIGLLPFSYGGILAALSLHVATEPRFKQRNGSWKWTIRNLNALFWLLLTCAMAIKVATEVEEQDKVGHRMGKQAKYPLVDEYTDDAAMVGVQFFLIFLEIITP